MSVYDPDKLEFSSENELLTNSYPFVAQKSGKHLVKFTLVNLEGGPANLTLQLDDNYKIPIGLYKKYKETVSGYEIEILESEPEGLSRESFLEITRSGVLKYILHKTDFTFSLFTEDYNDSGATSTSSKIYSTTIDKTGDGAPDTIIHFYSMGAHCCSEYRFIELGDIVWQRKNLYTGNSGLDAVGRSPSGGLIYRLYDDNFAYWLTSFADSPMPEVYLSFSKGILKPDISKMLKPPPDLKVLDKEAREIQTSISSLAYTGIDNQSSDVFPQPFWKRMLDLIYSNQDDIAWQYFDLVWPPKKSGKELFRKDFTNQLEKSDFYQSIKLQL